LPFTFVIRSPTLRTPFLLRKGGDEEWGTERKRKKEAEEEEVEVEGKEKEEGRGRRWKARRGGGRERMRRSENDVTVLGNLTTYTNWVSLSFLTQSINSKSTDSPRIPTCPPVQCLYGQPP